MTSSLLEKTSKGNLPKALLVLEDGSIFEGKSCAADGEVFGEVCFNTSLEGYIEVISDPSYAGQIVVMTYPQIGNYGVNLDDLQSSKLFLKGLVVKDMIFTPSNWRSNQSLPEYLKQNKIVAISGIDTRSLTIHLREKGSMRGVISTQDLIPESLLCKVKKSSSIIGTNLASIASQPENHINSQIPQSHKFAITNQTEPKFRVVVYDCGVKDSILQGLYRVGCELIVFPWNASPQDILDKNPDGIFLSNGPGDPNAVSEMYNNIKKLIGKVPIFGICLGHQMISLAADGQIEKLKFGHHGGNHPVMNLITSRVEITTQNHGFGLLFESLGSLDPKLSGGYTTHPKDLRFWAKNKIAPVVNNKKFGHIRLTHINLNDGTAEGIEFLDYPVFSVQFHPEASPGPTDSHYLFSAFANLMIGNKNYLNIDIAKDRLAGWKFKNKEV